MVFYCIVFEKPSYSKFWKPVFWLQNLPPTTSATDPQTHIPCNASWTSLLFINLYMCLCLELMCWWPLLVNTQMYVSKGNVNLISYTSSLLWNNGLQRCYKTRLRIVKKIMHLFVFYRYMKFIYNNFGVIYNRHNLETF